jgi:hypothetical protein
MDVHSRARDPAVSAFLVMCFFNDAVLTLALATIMRLDKVPSAGQEFFNR